MAKVFQVKDSEQWRQFTLANEGSFLQSWDWGELQKDEGKEVVRLGVERNGRVKALSQIIIHPIRGSRFAFFYLPLGPVLSSEASREDIDDLFKALKSKAQEMKGVIFFLIEPSTEIVSQVLLSKKQFEKSFLRFQPSRTLLIDLRRPLDEIFSSFKKRVRYSVSFAQKQNLKVQVSAHYQEFFYSFLSQTARRQRFRIFPKEHYQNLFKRSGNDFLCRLVWVEKENKKIAANILLFSGRRCFYLHSASDIELNRKFKASDLLQWEGIKLARETGCEVYDMWGIDEKKFPGVTFFKKGFSGYEFSYPEALVQPYSKVLYRFYKGLYLVRRVLV